MSSILENIDRLKSYLDKLGPRRSSDPLANDIYEEADDLRSFAQLILRGDTRVNYPARVLQERECIRRLEEFWSSRAPEELRRYAPVFEVAREILEAADAIQLPKDGHLGVLRIIRENFTFLETDYGFSVTSKTPTEARLSSGAVYLELGWGTTPDLSCSFGLESEPHKHFWIDDLLYLYGDQRYRTLPRDLHLDSENEVKNWIEFLAGVWRKYGHDVLANHPGTFDRLAQAQKRRDEEYTREMDRVQGNTSSDDTIRSGP